MKAISDQFRAGSVFKDQSKLSFDYVPEELPHREAQASKLTQLFKPILSEPMSQHVLLVGGVGTGKTALTKRFCQEFESYGAESGQPVEWIHINCRQRKSPSMVMLKVMGHFDRGFPDRGFSVPEMFEILKKHLDKRHTRLIFALDEADVLIKKSGSDLIYSLTRFQEEESSIKGGVSLILISQKDVLDYLDEATLSTFKRSNTIRFDPYTAPQLKDIVEQRIDLAFKAGVVDVEVPELIGDIASEYGDARFAIEILEKAGEICNGEGAQEVGAEHVRAAKAHTKSTISTSTIKGLDKQHQMVLLAVARSLRKKVFSKTGEVEKVYGVITEELGEKKRGHTQFWTYLQNLDAEGFIEAKATSKGIGTTTMISLPDIPANEIEKILSEILKLI